jgi:hypothetical protein
VVERRTRLTKIPCSKGEIRLPCVSMRLNGNLRTFSFRKSRHTIIAQTHAKRRFLSDARAEPPLISGMISNSSVLTPGISTA